MMPKTDGLYAIEKILEFDPHAKVVAVTADLTLETHVKLKKMNVTAIICKPFSPHEIRQVLLEKYKINTL